MFEDAWWPNQVADKRQIAQTLPNFSFTPCAVKLKIKAKGYACFELLSIVYYTV